MSHLVIVESPAKAKTIAKYLGGQFTVKATMGHLRDLPRSKMGLEMDGFVMDYQPVVGKEKTINELKKEAAKADTVYLATDPDREGEAISWHVKELLGLSDDQVQRVTFNEITKNVVQDSIRRPRALDMDLIDAQQARRALDRIVGYQLSPLLWRKVKPGLSAGRVQSVATRLVVDREEEIRAFVPTEYWTIDIGLLRTEGPGQFNARFVGNLEGKMELGSEQEAQKVIDAVRGHPISVHAIKKGEKKRNPTPPFITSTLQQDASRRLNMGPRRTMVVAQQLYEGVEISGMGLTGLITYMRTDSLRLSEEAVAEARELIRSQYGAEYLPAAARQFKSKKSAQDAHEAIRPSSAALTPDKIKDDLSPDQYKLYKLIWSRFIASQMEPAVFDTLSIDVLGASYLFRANHTSLRFAGFTAVYEEARDDDAPAPETPLPLLKEGEPLALSDVKPDQHFTQPPARYNEASLIRALEEKGIGRPSTYAPTISTIIEREYVRHIGRALTPTPLGEVITTMMKEKFSDIVDAAFTSRMEENLDEVEEGKVNWRTMLGTFYAGFEPQLTAAAEDPKRYRVPDEPTDEVCELCGRNMVIKVSRFGRFMACPGYPDCKNTKSITEPTPGECPKCGKTILKKKSRKGHDFYGCEGYPDCDFMTWDVPLADRCPECTKSLFKRGGRGATKPFCANPACVSFLPEDQRGYKRKPKAEGEGAGDEKAADAKSADKAAASKKASAKKSTAKKSPSTTKKATADKPMTAGTGAKTASAAKPEATTTAKTASAAKPKATTTAKTASAAKPKATTSAKAKAASAGTSKSATASKKAPAKKTPSTTTKKTTDETGS